LKHGGQLVCLVFAAGVAVQAHAQFENAPSPAQPDNAFDRAVANLKRDSTAGRLLEGNAYAQRRAPIADTDTDAGTTQTGDLSSWPRLYRADDLLVTGILNAAAGLFTMTNNYFDAPPALLGAQKVNPGWGEFFIEPGLSAQYKLGASASIYGNFSYVESSTRGMDNCCVGNIYYGNRELLYGGIRWRDAASDFALDASCGQQDFTVGDQMLLGRAGSNGAQRGANQLGPRNAWANAGILKATWQDWQAQAFYLKPDEAPASATGTVLNGVNVEWLPAGPVRLGAMYLHVPDSNIESRDQLNVYDLRARVHPLPTAPNFWLAGEYVWERKSAVAAYGWVAQANYNAQETTWKPLFTLRYASLSGDKSGTSNWEGFDPLYFSGSNPNWYQGKIGSSIFNNTNLNVASATLTLTPDEKNIVEFFYLYFTANQTNSPLSIPAVNTAPTGGGGVPAKALASEFDVQYTYIINKNVNISAFVAYAAPGAGYKELYSSYGGDASGWWFLGTQINVSY
jgi:Alginate export